MVFSATVEDVISITGCQVGSLPDLSLQTALVCALHFIFEHSLVTFLVRMVVGQVFGQSVLDVFILYVVLMSLLDPVGPGLAGLSVVDGLNVVGLALRTDGGVVGSTAGVTATWEPGATQKAAVLLEDTARQVHLHQESLQRDVALLDDPSVYSKSSQLPGRVEHYL